MTRQATPRKPRPLATPPFWPGNGENRQSRASTNPPSKRFFFFFIFCFFFGFFYFLFATVPSCDCERACRLSSGSDRWRDRSIDGQDDIHLFDPHTHTHTHDAAFCRSRRRSVFLRLATPRRLRMESPPSADVIERLSLSFFFFSIIFSFSSQNSVIDLAVHQQSKFCPIFSSNLNSIASQIGSCRISAFFSCPFLG